MVSRTLTLHVKGMIVNHYVLPIGWPHLSNGSMGLVTKCDLVVRTAGHEEFALPVRVDEN
jgi:hypothetical protein